MSDLGNKEIFANNLKYYMMINNKDRNDVCRDLEIPYSTFTDWVNGNIYPRIDKIQLLANYFGIQKSDLVENKENLKENKQAYPLLGTVKAGYDYLASQNVIGYINIDRPVNDLENCYALKVFGDSMEPILYNDDIIIVHKQDDVENGQVAIVLINDEATVKKIIKHDDCVELVAFNSYYPPKRLTKSDNFKIIGKVIEARITKIFE